MSQPNNWPSASSQWIFDNARNSWCIYDGITGQYVYATGESHPQSVPGPSLYPQAPYAQQLYQQGSYPGPLFTLPLNNVTTYNSQSHGAGPQQYPVNTFAQAQIPSTWPDSYASNVRPAFQRKIRAPSLTHNDNYVLSSQPATNTKRSSDQHYGKQSIQSITGHVNDLSISPTGANASSSEAPRSNQGISGNKSLSSDATTLSILESRTQAPQSSPPHSAFGGHRPQQKQSLPPPVGFTPDLSPEYKQVKRPQKFFVFGKVFLILWSEPGGSSRNSGTGQSLAGETAVSGRAWTRSSYNTWVYSKVRRFVVVKEGSRSCTAVPVGTNSGKGVGKPGVKKSDHAIIFTGKQPPELGPGEAPQAGEAGMQPYPIRIDPDHRDQKLEAMSRVDFGKPHTIQHYSQVKPFGKVNRDSEHWLELQYRTVQEGPTTYSNRGRAPDQRPSRSNSVQSHSALSQPEFRAAYDLLVQNGHDRAALALFQRTSSYQDRGEDDAIDEEEEEEGEEGDSDEADSDSDEDGAN